MEKKSIQLMRSCLACGLEKPLAAFLQVTGTQGTTYGNICATCRSTSAKIKIEVNPDSDDSGIIKPALKLKIDAKAKIQAEHDKIEFEKKHTDEIHEEHKKREEDITEKTERIQNKEKSEKDHRIGYIEAKQKQKGADYHSKPSSVSDQSIIKKTQQQDFIRKDQQKMEGQQREEVRVLEEKLTTIDMTQSYIDSPVGGLRFRSIVFQQFKDWLGSGANFRTLERFVQSKPENVASHPQSAVDQSKSEKDKKDPLIEYTEKNWNPSSSSTRRK